MRILNYISIIGLITFCLSADVQICLAQQKGINLDLEQGIGHYKHENYEEALPLLEQAREDEPSSTLAAYYLGLNYKRLQDYEKAIPNLRDSVTYRPKIKGALIELIDCLYQLDYLKEAHKWIKEAKKQNIRPAQVDFLLGLVRAKEGKFDQAIDAFEAAKRQDETLTQASDYQIGIAYLKAKKLEEAQQIFRTVADLRPSSNLARYANEYIEAINERQDALRPFQLSFTTAWQYDDNVVLRPEDSSIATNITDQSDWRMIYALQTQYNHRHNETFGIKGQYNFYFAKQNDLGFYDTMSHMVNVEPHISFDKSLLSFPTTFTHTMVDDRSYLASPSTGALFNFAVGGSQMGQLYARYIYKDFLWTPFTPAENRDGNEFAAGGGWYWFFAQKKGFINVSYGHNRDFAEGNNWKYTGNRFTATLLVPIKDKINFSVSNSVYFQNFDNVHTFFGVERDDTVYSVSTLLAYKFYKDSELQIQYTFIRDDSNIGVFDYERNIYSVGVQMRF